jgi:DNA end-binding protein Ku
MVERPSWSGYLKFSLVVCPVVMMPATTDSEAVRFHTINRRTGHRVVSRYVDSRSGAPVDDDEQVMGYPRGEDQYVLLEEGDLDSVALASTRTIDIETFVPADSIGWIWYDAPHFLMPGDAIGAEAFAVIRAAMNAAGMVGIARLVLYRRERAVLLEPRGKGIVMWTLHDGHAVREADTPVAGKAAAPASGPEMALLATLIDRQTRDWDPGMVRDPVRDRLRDLIAARRKGRKRVPVQAVRAAKGAGVVSIMDALRASLERDRLG